MTEIKFKLVPAIYDSETKTFKPSEKISKDQFYLTIFNSNIECKPEEEILWFAVLDFVEGTLDINTVMQLVKVGQEAQKIRVSKIMNIIEPLE